MAGGDWWNAPSADGPLDATVVLPGSKSQTARALLLGAVSGTPLLVDQPLSSRDTILAGHALAQLGVRFEAANPESITVLPPPFLGGGGIIDCGLAGTVMRFVPAIAAFGPGTVTFDGDPAARTRPIRALLETLGQLGARVEYLGHPGFLPFAITGIGQTTPPARVRLDSSISSQFLSALLLGFCLSPVPIEIELLGTPPSAPHIQMTIDMLAQQDVVVERLSPTLYRAGGQRPSAQRIRIEPDLSNAGPFLAAAIITGGTIRIAGWPRHTSQAGDWWRTEASIFGARVTSHDDGLTFTAPNNGGWPGVDLDLSQVGELAPTIAALCLLADGPSRLRGIGHLRGHETDRLEALAAEIRRCGGRAQVLEDGLQITPDILHPADFESYHDHRMATFGALLGLALPGSRVRDIDTTSKTLPNFPARWNAMLAGEVSPPVESLSVALSSDGRG